MVELTPEQVREHHLSRTRAYAIEPDPDGEHIARNFGAGVAAPRSVRFNLAKSEAA